MKLEWKEQLKIPDGLHEGVIIGIDNRTEPYNYTDLVIETEVDEIITPVKAGYATKLTESTKLGKLLQRFGVKPAVGTTIDLNKLLIGQKCQFQTVTESTKKGEFAKVLGDTVKPV